MDTVVDMIVHPDYQRRGIGRQIMQNLQSRLKGFLVVTLPALAEMQPFYTKLGWRKMNAYRGKRVRMSAWVRSDGADSAQLWMRLDGPNGSMLGFDNMDNRKITGTTDWKKYEITLDVPDSTINLAFGAFVAGRGQAWVDDFAFEIVGKEVPTTNIGREAPTQQSLRQSASG